MAEHLSGILDGHSFVVWRALWGQSTDRRGYNHTALVGLLLFIVIEESRRLSGLGYALLVLCPVIERAIRRCFP